MSKNVKLADVVLATLKQELRAGVAAEVTKALDVFERVEVADVHAWAAEFRELVRVRAVGAADNAIARRVLRQIGKGAGVVLKHVESEDGDPRLPKGIEYIVRETMDRMKALTKAERSILLKDLTDGVKYGVEMDTDWRQPTTVKPRVGESGSRRLEIVCMDDVPLAEQPWTIPGWLPAGDMALLSGEGGVGKSQVAIAIAAAISKGKRLRFVDYADPLDPKKLMKPVQGRVLILNLEDKLGTTMKARLIAAGANMSNILSVATTLTEDAEGNPVSGLSSMHEDAKRINEALKNYPDVKLIVIDPVMAYLGAKDSNSEQQVRSALASMTDVAERHGAALLIVAHLNKGTNGQRGRHRVGGSAAFVNRARSVILAGPVAGGKQDETGNVIEFAIVQDKANLGKRQGSVTYTMEQTIAAAPTNGSIVRVPTSRIVWGEKGDLTAKHVTSNDSTSDKPSTEDRIEEAVDWLRAQLADGPVPADTMKTRCSAAGFPRRIIQGAKATLDIVVKPFEYQGPVHWMLPDHADAEDTN